MPQSRTWRVLYRLRYDTPWLETPIGATSSAAAWREFTRWLALEGVTDWFAAMVMGESA